VSAFDTVAKAAAVTINSVFGGVFYYARPGKYAFDCTVTIRRDVELLDDHNQVVARTNTARIAVDDLPDVLPDDFEPLRGDTITSDSESFTLGRRISDDGFFFVHEITS